MPVIPGAQQSHINFIPIDTTPSPWTLTNWFVTADTSPGDFTDSIEDMLRLHLYNNWGTPIAITPFKSINPPADFNSKVRFGDHEYDYFSTYYIRVKEEDTAFDNDLIINGGCFPHEDHCKHRPYCPTLILR